jgi:hypothetical protein
MRMEEARREGASSGQQREGESKGEGIYRYIRSKVLGLGCMCLPGASSDLLAGRSSLASRETSAPSGPVTAQLPAGSNPVSTPLTKTCWLIAEASPLTSGLRSAFCTGAAQRPVGCAPAGYSRRTLSHREKPGGRIWGAQLLSRRGGTHLLSGQSCFRASPVLLAHPYGISKLELRAAHAHGGAADAGHLLRRLKELLAPMACFGISARSEPRCGLMLAWVRPRLASAGLGWPRLAPRYRAEPGASLNQGS